MLTTNLKYLLLCITFMGIFSCNIKHDSKKLHILTHVDKLKTKGINSLLTNQIKTDTLSNSYVYKKAIVSQEENRVKNCNINALIRKEISAKRKLSHHSPLYISNYQKTIKKKAPSILKIIFDNDIWDNTDYYYTNGVRLSMTSEMAETSILKKVLFNLKNPNISLAGFTLVQNMYTPTNPESPTILYNDHPFAGFLFLGQFLQTVNYKKRLNIYSEFDLGVIGPASLAGIIQTRLHEKKPVGWKNQIHNDIIINYSLKIEKGVVSNPHFELNVKSSAHAGTLYDDISTGIYLRTGSFIPVYKGGYWVDNTFTKSRFQYWFFITCQTKGVFYDATLQGGMFSHSPYTIEKQNVNRFVFQASAGIALYYGPLGIELENFYSSPQFNEAVDFRYGRINISIYF